MAREWATGFSDDHTTLHDLLAAEDGRVIARFTSRVTHSGDAFGLKASHRTVTITGIDICAVADGKVADWWGELNLSELLNPPDAATSGGGQSLG